MWGGCTGPSPEKKKEQGRVVCHEEKLDLNGLWGLEKTLLSTTINGIKAPPIKLQPKSCDASRSAKINAIWV